MKAVPINVAMHAGKEKVVGVSIDNDGFMRVDGIDGRFRKVEIVKPDPQMFNDDGWNGSVRIIRCPRCMTLIPPFTSWNYCPGCGVEFDWS